MSVDEEETDKPDKKPDEKPASETAPRRVRFPYARIAIGVVGILLSVWLWVGESWRFDVTPEELLEGSPGWGWKGGWVGRYVRLAAEVDPVKPWQDGHRGPINIGVRGTHERLQVHLASSSVETRKSSAFAGRIGRSEEGDVGAFLYSIDTARGRWTGKSVFAVLIFLWGAGIIVSSVWIWRKRREAADNGHGETIPPPLEGGG